MAIKAIIFDLDNTLLDFFKFKRACIRAAVHAMLAEGLGISEKRAEQLIFEIYHEYGYEYHKIFNKFLKITEGQVDYKLLAPAIVAYRLTRDKVLKPYPNVKPTLQKLHARGVKLAILTDAPKLQAYLRLAETGLLDYFNPILTLSDTKRRKPSPKPFRAALAALKLKPTEVLMVGDTPARDITGARKIGIHTVLARYGLMPHIAPKPAADYEISDISQLVALVRTIR